MMQALGPRGQQVIIIWIPATRDAEIIGRAKRGARAAAERDQKTGQAPYRGISTLTANILKKLLKTKLPNNIGIYSKKLDNALPGNHTRELYDSLNRPEANILAQLRTGMTHLNKYLRRISASASDQCACRQEKETMEHYLFRCTR